jgi:hypothetical protein
MSEGYQRDRAGNGNAGQARNTFPALTLSSIWGPLFSGALQANAQAQEVFGTIAGAWQAFLGHRIQEDLALIQRVTHSATPDQILAAYSEFWQKAAEDYRKEFAAVTKLLTKMSRKAAAVSQTATGETSANAFLSQNAA